MKSVRIFLLILIIIGIGLLITQKMWVPKLVGIILQHEEAQQAIAPASEEYGDDVNGRHIGYIKSISSQNGTNSLTIDYVTWYYCANQVKIVCPNVVRIINDNTKLRTFPIKKDVPVTVETVETRSISFAAFVKGLDTIDGSLMFGVDPVFWITIKNGVVTEIAGQYHP